MKASMEYSIIHNNDKKKLFDKVGIKYRLTRMIKKIQEKVNSMSFIPKYHPMHKKSHTKENSQKNRLFRSNTTKKWFQCRNSLIDV